MAHRCYRQRKSQNAVLKNLWGCGHLWAVYSEPLPPLPSAHFSPASLWTARCAGVRKLVLKDFRDHRRWAPDIWWHLMHGGTVKDCQSRDCGSLGHAGAKIFSEQMSSFLCFFPPDSKCRSVHFSKTDFLPAPNWHRGQTTQEIALKHDRSNQSKNGKYRKYRKLSRSQSAPECEESQHRYLAIWTWTCFDHRLSIRRWLAFPIEVQMTWSHRHAMPAIQCDCNYKGDDYFLRNSWELLNYLMPWGYGIYIGSFLGSWPTIHSQKTQTHTHTQPH